MTGDQACVRICWNSCQILHGGRPLLWCLWSEVKYISQARHCFLQIAADYLAKHWSVIVPLLFPLSD